MPSLPKMWAIYIPWGGGGGGGGGGDLHACQVRVSIGDSGLCCICITHFQCLLTPLFVGSVQALWASFCFRFEVFECL